MKILVTGSSGFVGSNLVSRLNRTKHKVITYDVCRNKLETLSNINLLKRKLKGIDIVYHLAGISSPDSPDLFKVNVEGTFNLVNILNDLNSNAKIIFASTFGVYKIPEKGDYVNEKYQIDPRNEYGKSKFDAEKIILSSKRNMVFRFSNIYGPNMSAGRHSVVANIIDSAFYNKIVKVYEMDTTRDFLYVDDAVDSLVKAAKYDDGGIFNVCTGVETSISDLIRVIEIKTDRKIKLDLSAHTSDGGYWKGDNSKIRRILKWHPRTNLGKGISNIVDKKI